MVARMGTAGAAQGCVAGEVAASRCRRPAYVTIGFAYLNYCDRLRSLSIAYVRFALCKDNCTQRVRVRRGRWTRLRAAWRGE